MGQIANMIESWATRSPGSSRTSLAHPAQWLVDYFNGGTSAAGVNVSQKTALKYTPFWAAVRIIAGTVGALPFKVYSRTASGKQPEPMHPVYALLHDRPNPYMDAVTFQETRQAHVLTHGNGYAEIQRDGAGRPIALWPLLPDRTSRQLTDAGQPYYEVRTSPGQTVTIPDENVLHIKGLGFDGYSGYDVVSYHKDAIGYGVAVKEYGARFFSNDGNPGGILEHPNKLSAPAKQYLKKSWAANHSGLSNAHRMQILEEGMKWNQIGVDPAKAQALEVQKWTVDDCARIFQIPPHKLGSMEFSKFNNVEQLQIDFVCTTMLYWFAKWEQECNYKLFGQKERGRLFCEILVDGLLRGNVEARTKFYMAGRQWGYLSINDIRAKENMNAIGPAGDVYLDPLNMKPAGAPWPDEPTEPDPDAGAAPPADDEDDDAVRAAIRALLTEQWGRILRKTTKANHKGTTGDDWTRHRRFARDILLDTARAWAAVIKVPAAEQRLARVLDSTLLVGAQLAETDADRLAGALMDAIESGGGCGEARRRIG